MNGAELPCGTAIGVQPADTDYKKKLKNGGEQSAAGAEPAKTSSMEKKIASTAAANEAISGESKGGSKEKNAKDEDDLDDFFASLE